MGILVLIAIPLALLAGAYVLTRAKPSAEPPTPPAPRDHGPLREAVAAALRARLPGYVLELPPDEPLTLVALDAGTERRLVLDLEVLAERWHAAQEAGQGERAAELVEAFVRGATGEGAGAEAELDPEAVLQALSVVLVRAGRTPRGGVSRPAASLEAVLVLRRPDGYDVLAGGELAGLGVGEDQAFARALANLSQDVDEGLVTLVLDGDEQAPRVLQVAPDDPLAASYALVPALAMRMFDRLRSKNVAYYVLGERHFIAADAAVDIGSVIEIEGQVLERSPIGPGDIVWR
jgi:hypothetical protein